VDPILTRLGLSGREPMLLHDRRGTTVYRTGDTALKITSGLMAGREGDILRLLGTEFYRDHGWEDDRPPAPPDPAPSTGAANGQSRSWLLLRWPEGTTLWDALEPAHRGDDSTASRDRVLAMTADAAGWTHGDLQPDHILFEAGVTHLIDLAFAQGPAAASASVPFYRHRGGLAHTTAPEIAEAILATGAHVVATPQADVWSLGASLWWSWTRTPPITCSDPAARRAGQLADIAALRRAPSTARPWPFLAFEDLVRACLAADPADRPTTKQLAADLLWTPSPNRPGDTQGSDLVFVVGGGIGITQLAQLREQKAVGAVHAEVPADERRQPGHVLLTDRVAPGLQLTDGRIQRAGVLGQQRIGVARQAQRGQHLRLDRLPRLALQQLGLGITPPGGGLGVDVAALEVPVELLQHAEGVGVPVHRAVLMRGGPNTSRFHGPFTTAGSIILAGISGAGRRLR
jgi:hypothetical protein